MAIEKQYKIVTDWNAVIYVTAIILGVVFFIFLTLNVVVALMLSEPVTSDMLIFSGITSIIGVIIGSIIAYIVSKRNGDRLFTKIIVEEEST